MIKTKWLWPKQVNQTTFIDDNVEWLLKNLFTYYKIYCRIIYIEETNYIRLYITNYNESDKYMIEKIGNSSDDYFVLCNTKNLNYEKQFILNNLFEGCDFLSTFSNLLVKTQDNSYIIIFKKFKSKNKSLKHINIFNHKLERYHLLNK